VEKTIKKIVTAELGFLLTKTLGKTSEIIEHWKRDDEQLSVWLGDTKETAPGFDRTALVGVNGREIIVRISREGDLLTVGLQYSVVPVFAIYHPLTGEVVDSSEIDEPGEDIVEEATRREGELGFAETYYEVEMTQVLKDNWELLWENEEE